MTDKKQEAFISLGVWLGATFKGKESKGKVAQETTVGKRLGGEKSYLHRPSQKAGVNHDRRRGGAN